MRTVFVFLTFFISLHYQNAFSTSYRLLYDGEKVGLSDEDGKILIPAIYEGLGWSNGKSVPVNNLIGFKNNDLWGILTLENKEILASQFTQLYPEEGGLFIASRQGKYSHRDFIGLITPSGKEVLPFKYTSIETVGVMAIVGIKSGRNYLYGVVDQGDKTVIPIQYKSIQPLGKDKFAVKEFTNKMALYGANGLKISPFEIDSISAFYNGYAITYANHLRGLINDRGDIIDSPRHKDVSIQPSVQTLSFDHWELIENRKVVDTWHYDVIQPVGVNYYKVMANGKQWIIDSTNSSITSSSYDYIRRDENSNYIFRNSSGWGVLKPDSTLVLAPVYDSVLAINGRYFVRDKDDWLFFDSFGIRKTDQKYEAVKQNSTNYITIQKNGKWGVINNAGEEVIHCSYQEISPMENGRMVVKFHGHHGVIDKMGSWVVLPQSGLVKLLTDDLYLRMTNDLTVLKSFDGETIYFTTNRIDIKKDHLLEHLQEGGLWKIDFNGRIVNRNLPQQKFQEIRSSSEGLFAVKINNRYGFVDNQNRLLVANRYENVGDFKEGLAAVKLLGRWGFIDKSENLVIQPVYSEVSAFNNGVATVKQGGTMGIINKSGSKVSTFDYNSIEPQTDGKFLVEKNNKYGLLGRDGSLRILAKYDYIEELSNGFVKASLFGKYGVLTDTGVDVIPLIYDDLIYDLRFDRYLAMKKSAWENLSD